MAISLVSSFCKVEPELQTSSLIRSVDLYPSPTLLAALLLCLTIQFVPMWRSTLPLSMITSTFGLLNNRMDT